MQFSGILLLLIVTTQANHTIATLLPTCSSTCPSGCSNCPSNLCTACLPGYTYFIENHSCITNNCTAIGCSLCDSQGSCLKCSNQYSIYENFSQSCVQKCILEGCEKCKAGSNICQQCEEGFALYGWTNQCIFSPIQNCLSIHDWKSRQFQCSLCLPGYKPSSDRTLCIKNECQTIKDCEMCSNSSFCDKCVAGHRFSQGICTLNPCNITNCLLCNKQGLCIKSISSHFIVGLKVLPKSCSLSNCAICKPNSIFCDSCSLGSIYNIWSKRCQTTKTSQNQQSSSNLKYLWLLLIVAGIIGLVVIIKVTKSKNEEEAAAAEAKMVIQKRKLPYLAKSPVLYGINNMDLGEPPQEVASQDCPKIKMNSKLPPLNLPQKNKMNGVKDLKEQVGIQSSVGIQLSHIQIKVPSFLANQLSKKMLPSNPQ